jgi:hypothetical protein
MDPLAAQSPAEPTAVTFEFRQVYRTRSQAVRLGCFLVFGTVFGVEGAVRGSSHSTIGFVLSGILFLLIAIPMARGALAVLVVTDRAVTVRNPFRTVSIAWGDIEAFELGRYAALGCVCLIRHVDRTVVPAFAVQGITGQPRRRTSVRAQQTVDELNERLRRKGPKTAFTG